MKKVYIVTEGIYSDYHIERVYDNEKAAQEYCDILSQNKYSTPRVETFVIGGLVNKDNCRKRYHVIYGNNLNINDWDAMEITSDSLGICCDLEGYNKDGAEYIVLAKDKEHAIKIAQDKYAIWKAKKEGIA